MAGGGQKWLIFRSKSGCNGRLVPGQGTNLETVLCAISPPNTWDSMITWNSMMLDHFCVLSVLLTVIFGAILHFFIQGMTLGWPWDGQKWPKVMLSHVFGGDMAHKTVSRLVPCPGTSLPLRPDFDLKISHF